MPWLCELVRFTALWNAPNPQAESALNWEAVFRTPPDQRDEQPKIALLREVGVPPGSQATVEFRRAPGRVDWLVSPTFTPGGPRDGLEFYHLGPVADAVETYLNLLVLPIAERYEAPRFAFGLIAHHITDSQAASYSELVDLLRLRGHLNLEGASDFAFQINRPRRSAVLEGLLVNRVSRWSSALITGLQIALPTTGEQVIKRRAPVNTTRAELDINSDAEHAAVIPAANRAPLIREFAEWSMELLERGDIP